jgi:hypothetical protein
MMAPFDAVFDDLNLGEIVVPVNPEADSIAHRHPRPLAKGRFGEIPLPFAARDWRLVAAPL